MIKSTILLATLALLSFPACTGGGGDGSGGGGGNGGGGGGGGGNGSGVPGATQLSDLTPAQVMTFCSWAIIDIQGGENIETECGDGLSVDTGTVAECTADYADLPVCDLTVAQVELCMLEVGDDPCLAFQSPECADYISCIFAE